MNAVSTQPDSSSPLVQVRNLRAGYGSKVILKDVSMQVLPGEIRVVLGGSGSGKSTLLRNVLGLESPIAGEAIVFDTDLSPDSGAPPAAVAEARNRLGVLFQNGALVTSLSVGQNVMLPLVLDGIAPRGAAEELARARLAQVHMGDAWSLMPNELSGGMRKRAALARALIREPQVLFCDEPSAGLDPLTSRELDDLLLELHDSLGLAMVLVTHELDSIHALAQNILYLHEGVVLFDGLLADALDHGPERVKDFFARRTDPTNALAPSTWEIIR